MSIVENDYRVGRPTSSNMNKLVGIGTRKMTAKELADFKAENPKSKATTIKCLKTPDEKFYTYANKKYGEICLGRSFDLGKGSKSTAWGDLMEMYLFEEHQQFKTELAYSLKSKTTYIHQVYKYWAGSPDIIVHNDIKRVAEVKCYEPENFVKYANALMANDVQILRDRFPDEYWQIVSNACIMESIMNEEVHGEALLFMPFEKDIETIREWIETTDLPSELHRFRYIAEGSMYELPYVPEGSIYKDLISFKFDIPKEDKLFLEMRVKMFWEEIEKMAQADGNLKRVLEWIK